MKDIDFTVSNIKRCMCLECSVQRDSQCFEGKRRIMLEIAYSSESGMYFERENVPGIYCSTGRSRCPDLDFKKDCQCSSCPVWKDYGLKNEYHCQFGRL